MEMSELVLYDAPGTPSPRRVKMCLLEKGLPFKIKWLNIALMDQKTPSYLKLNPTGLVPSCAASGVRPEPGETERMVEAREAA
jgi:hypothetical protein